MRSERFVSPPRTVMLPDPVKSVLMSKQSIFASERSMIAPFAPISRTAKFSKAEALSRWEARRGFSTVPFQRRSDFALPEKVGFELPPNARVPPFSRTCA